MMDRICFAYYSDGKFMGWYSGTAGGVSSQYAKQYSSARVVKDNFTKYTARGYLLMYSVDQLDVDPSEFDALDKMYLGRIQRLDPDCSLELRVVPASHVVEIDHAEPSIFLGTIQYNELDESSEIFWFY